MQKIPDTVLDGALNPFLTSEEIAKMELVRGGFKGQEEKNTRRGKADTCVELTNHGQLCPRKSSDWCHEWCLKNVSRWILPLLRNIKATLRKEITARFKDPDPDIQARITDDNMIEITVPKAYESVNLEPYFPRHRPLNIRNRGEVYIVSFGRTTTQEASNLVRSAIGNNNTHIELRVKNMSDFMLWGFPDGTVFDYTKLTNMELMAAKGEYSHDYLNHTQRIVDELDLLELIGFKHVPYGKHPSFVKTVPAQTSYNQSSGLTGSSLQRLIRRLEVDESVHYNMELYVEALNEYIVTRFRATHALEVMKQMSHAIRTDREPNSKRAKGAASSS